MYYLISMFCPRCGKQLDEGQTVCLTCGATILTSPSSAGASGYQPAIPQWSPPPPGGPPRTVKFSHFLIVTLTLTVLLGASLATIASLTVQLRDYGNLQQQFKALAAQNFDLQNQVMRLRISAANPTLTIWNSCGVPCSMGPGFWRVGGVPDTFDYNVSFTSTVPVTVYFLTFDQYVQFANCSGQISCVTGTYSQFGPTTVLQGTVFKLGEGCSGYVAVYQSTSNGTIYPNVKVTYNPSPTLTGTCATNP